MTHTIDILIGANTAERVGYYLKLFENQTYKDFRVVCLCKEEIKDDFSFEFRYIQEKGHKFWPAIRSMRHAIYKNELMLYAEAKYILLWDAWQIPVNELIDEHVKYLKQGYGVAGTREECSNLAVDWRVGDNLEIKNKDLRSVPLGPTHGGNWWNCNCSAPLSKILDVNGFDMRFAGGTSGEDCDLGIRLEKAGLKIIYNPKAIMYHTNHDIWKGKKRLDKCEFSPPGHNTFKFRNSTSWDPSTSGDDNLMEDEKIVCWYDNWGLKRWRCKFCGEEGLVESMHLHRYNEQNNIVRTPCGLVELKEGFELG